MSHFCANTISIDPEGKTCKLRGGDNNLVLRSNSWTGPIPLRVMIYEVCGGMIQFTTRSDKNLWFEQTALEYGKQLKKLTSLTPYEVGDLPTDPACLEKARENWRRSVTENAWDNKQCKRLLDISADSVVMQKIEEIKDQFVNTILAGPSKAMKVLRSGTCWVYRVLPSKLKLCYDRRDAKPISIYKANDVVQQFNDIIVEPV